MEEEEPVLWKAESSSMLSSMVGRVMNTLLSARLKKLEDVIVKLGETPKSTLAGTKFDLRGCSEEITKISGVIVALFCAIRLFDSFFCFCFCAATLEDSLRILIKYVRDSVDDKQPLDEVIIPMIENVMF